MNQSPVDTIQEVYAAFGRGDVQAILDRVSEDTEWVFNAKDTRVPWYGPWRGKAELPKCFGAMAQNMDFQTFEPRKFIASGNDVVSEVHLEYTVKPTGKKVGETALFWWTLDDSGKIARLIHFEDTGQVQRAYSG